MSCEKHCSDYFVEIEYRAKPIFLWDRIMIGNPLTKSLQWRHNGRNSVSNHQPRECLLGRLFGRRWKKTSKLRVTGLCVGNSPGTSEFPAQMASNAENVSIWWRHHGIPVNIGVSVGFSWILALMWMPQDPVEDKSILISGYCLTSADITRFKRIMILCPYFHIIPHTFGCLFEI